MRFSQFGLIAVVAVIAIVAVIAVPGKRSSPRETASHSETVAKADFKGTWPFSVSRGTLRCSPPRSVLFDTTNGYEYGLNAAARADGYAPPDAIRSAPAASLTDLVNRGLALCRG